MKLVNIDTKITALLWDEEGEETEKEMTVGEFLDLYTVEGLLGTSIVFSAFPVYDGQDELPSVIDARPVPQANWMRVKMSLSSDAEIFVCSACTDVAFRISKYCPNCGAKMKEVHEVRP